jgi:hypothetical protein
VAFRQLDDHAATGVVGERPQERWEVGDVVEDVVAHDDVGRRRVVCDVGPSSGDLLVVGSSLLRPFGKRAEHRRALVHGNQ